MAISDTLRGKYIDLVCAEESDAEFTLEIRNDPELTKYIPVLSGDIEGQKRWINNQREKEFDVFYVIKRKDETPIGTLSFYDYVEGSNSCEIGRYISHGNAFENIEAVLLMLDFLFSEHHVDWVLLNIHENNTPVISLWKRFGAQFVCDEQKDGWKSVQYHLKRIDYDNNREMIAKLLRY